MGLEVSIRREELYVDDVESTSSVAGSPGSFVGVPTTTAIAGGSKTVGTTPVATARFHSSGTTSIATPNGVTDAGTANVTRIAWRSGGALKPATGKRSIASIASADATGGNWDLVIGWFGNLVTVLVAVRGIEPRFDG